MAVEGAFLGPEGVFWLHVWVWAVEGADLGGGGDMLWISVTFYWSLGGVDRFGLGLWRGLRGHFGPWWGDRFGFSAVEGAEGACFGPWWGDRGFRLWRGLRGCFGPWWGDRFGFRLWRGLRGHFGPWGVTGLGVSCGGGGSGGVGICGCIGMGWGGTVGLGTRFAFWALVG